MKALIQIADNCTLTIDHSSEPFSHIDYGMLVLLGVGVDDDENDVIKLAKKVAGLRIFPDENGKMNLSCTDSRVNGKFMVVSQFTLYGDCTHGKRPDMFGAARPDKAIPLYELFKKVLQEECEMLTGTKDNYVVCGEFGADMQISFTNSGPVTFMIESDKLR